MLYILINQAHIFISLNLFYISYHLFYLIMLLNLVFYVLVTMILGLLCAIYARIQLSHNHYISIFHNFCINRTVRDCGMNRMDGIYGIGEIGEMMLIYLLVFNLVSFYQCSYLDIDFHEHYP